MPLTPTGIREQICRCFNSLHYQQGVSIMDINFTAFGMITSSLQDQLGAKEGREYIEQCMDNVWGKKKKRWRLF